MEIKEQLVTHILNLKQEVSRNNSKIQSLTQHQNWILDKTSQVLDKLNLIEALDDASSIDNASTNPCASSPSTKEW